jgi:dihydroorotate dehydrogenase
MIVGNTTISRPPTLRAAAAKEAGGLSGKPLFALSTRMLAETYVRAENAFPLIGAGGIEKASDAVAKLRAGATLVQLYTGLVFRGLGLLGEIKSGLVDALATRNSLDELTGTDVAAITAEPWPV